MGGLCGTWLARIQQPTITNSHTSAVHDRIASSLHASSSASTACMIVSSGSAAPCARRRQYQSLPLKRVWQQTHAAAASQELYSRAGMAGGESGLALLSPTGSSAPSELVLRPLAQADALASVMSSAASQPQSGGGAISTDATVAMTSLGQQLLAPEYGLMAQLQAAHNYNNLRKLLQVADRRLEPQHYRAALSKLSQLMDERPPSHAPQKQDVQSILEAITEGLLPHIPHSTPGQLVGSCYTLARLHYFDGPFLRAAMRAAALQVQQLRYHQVSGLLWALASYNKQFKLPVDDGLVAALLTQHLQQLNKELLQQQHLAQHPLHPAQQPQLQQPLQDAGDADYDAEEHLGHESPRSLADSAAAAANASGQVTRSLVQVLVGCALLQHRPSAAWLQVCLSQIAQSAPHAPPGQLCSALRSLAVLGCRPAAGWMQQVLDASMGHWGGCSGAQLSSMLWALAKLQHAPSPKWMDSFVEQARLHFHLCSAHDLSVIAWSLAKLQYRPDRRWANQFSGRLLRRLGHGRGLTTSAKQPCCSPADAANMLWVLAWLNLQPRSAVVAQLCNAVSAQRCMPRQLSLALWASQRFGYLPSDQWMEDAQAALLSRSQSLDQTTCIVALVALGGCNDLLVGGSKRFSRQFQADDALVAALLLRLEASTCNTAAEISSAAPLSLKSYLTLLLALVRLHRAAPSQQLTYYILLQAALHLDEIPAAKLPLVCWAVGRLGSSPTLKPILTHLHLLPRIEDLTPAYLRSTACCGRDLLQLAAGFAAASYQPRDSWRDLHQRASFRLMRAGLLPHMTALALMSACQRLQWDARWLARFVRDKTVRELRDAIRAAATMPAWMDEQRWQEEQATRPWLDDDDDASTSVNERVVTEGDEAAGGPETEPLPAPMFARDLEQLLLGFQRVSCPPGTRWLQLHEQCALQLAKSNRLKQSQARRLLDAYQQLAYTPKRLLARLESHPPPCGVVHRRLAERAAAQRGSSPTWRGA